MDDDDDDDREYEYEDRMSLIIELKDDNKLQNGKNQKIIHKIRNYNLPSNFLEWLWDIIKNTEINDPPLFKNYAPYIREFILKIKKYLIFPKYVIYDYGIIIGGFNHEFLSFDTENSSSKIVNKIQIGYFEQEIIHSILKLDWQIANLESIKITLFKNSPQKQQPLIDEIAKIKTLKVLDFSSYCLEHVEIVDELDFSGFGQSRIQDLKLESNRYLSIKNIHTLKLLRTASVPEINLERISDLKSLVILHLFGPNSDKSYSNKINLNYVPKTLPILALNHTILAKIESTEPIFINTLKLFSYSISSPPIDNLVSDSTSSIPQLNTIEIDNIITLINNCPYLECLIYDLDLSSFNKILANIKSLKKLWIHPRYDDDDDKGKLKISGQEKGLQNLEKLIIHYNDYLLRIPTFVGNLTNLKYILFDYPLEISLDLDNLRLLKQLTHLGKIFVKKDLNLWKNAFSSIGMDEIVLWIDDDQERTFFFNFSVPNSVFP